jgi:hypothetical protein
VPAEFAHLPVLGTVRDPLSYYVSWYSFQRSMRQPNALFMICSDDGVLGFEATIRNLLWLEQDEVRLRLLEEAVPETFVSNGLNLTKRCVRDLRGCGLGFYAYLYRRMYGGAPSLHLIGTEYLRVGLPPLLTQFGFPPDDDAASFLRDAPDLNRSEHGEVSDFYDAAMSDEVRVRDSLVWTVREGLSDTMPSRSVVIDSEGRSNHLVPGHTHAAEERQ